MKRQFLIGLIVLSFLILAGGTRRVNAQGRQRQVSEKPTVRVIVTGQETHGKSTLTSAITKVLSEEKRAPFVSYDTTADPPEIELLGVKVKATEVTYETSKQRYSHMDCHSNADCEALLSSRRARFDGAIDRCRKRATRF